ncbi:MAG: A24 family peptidase [Bacteriovoracia bacterium]
MPVDKMFEVFFTVFGAVVGSFLNVLIYRLPKGFHINKPARSVCPQCKKQIPWYDNIPIVSFLFLKGKCRNCKKKISPRYFIVELLSALLFLGIFRNYGMFFESLYYVFFAATLIAITFIDLEYYIIPDLLSFTGIAVGLFGSFWVEALGPVSSLLGIIFGGGSFWLLSFLYEKATNREGLGFGDVKMLAMIGAFLGPQGVLFTILVSSLTGSVIGLTMMVLKKKNLKMALPYGPFLAIGALVFIFWGDWFSYLCLLQ